MNAKRLVVTGATGFVGKNLLDVLLARGFHVRALVRNNASIPQGAEIATDWSDSGLRQAMNAADAIIHLASRNHRSGAEMSDDSAYREDILNLSERLADAAAASNVGKFIYLSSIKARSANDDAGGRPTPYARYKREAELAITARLEGSGCDLVILRPPLVYDLDAKGNFGTLVKLSRKGIPVPIRASSGKRAMISRDNLIDVIATVAAANEKSSGDHIYEVCDGKAYTLEDQIRAIASRLGRPARILRLPDSIFDAAISRLAGPDALSAIVDHLEVSNIDIERDFRWKPSHSWLASKSGPT